MPVKFHFDENIIIKESDIIDLLNKINEINTYGSIIKDFCMNSQRIISINFSNENTMINIDNAKSISYHRGFQLSNSITIYCTRYETLESIKWMFLHELTHLILDTSLLTTSMLYFVQEKYYKDKGLIKTNNQYYYLDELLKKQYVECDDIHENDPEEKLANDFASHLIGQDYSRPWWRERIKIIDNENK